MELDGGKHDEFQPQESVERNFAKVGKGARVVFELTTPIQKHLLVVEISATPTTNVNGLAHTANAKILPVWKMLHFASQPHGSQNHFLWMIIHDLRVH